jgi:LPXTG-motif cell wall-anchored protein
MRRISPMGVAIAGLAFALAPAAFAQDTTSSTNTNADSHVQDQRKETSPSAAQNDPERGAKDPARVGTMTQSNNDANNNRNPNAPLQSTTTQTTTSPSTTYETTTPSNTEYTSTTTSEIVPVAPAPVAVATDTKPATLPKTASTMPLAGLAGLSALGAALAFRSRRLVR